MDYQQYLFLERNLRSVTAHTLGPDSLTRHTTRTHTWRKPVFMRVLNGYY